MTSDELLRELDEEAQATRRVLERVPEDRLDWKPHEKSMTLGQLAHHVAMLPGAIAELSLEPGMDVRTDIPRPEAASVAGLLDTLDESVARAKRVLGGLDDDTLRAEWKLTQGDREIMAIPRAALLRSIMLNHWYHHRGQLSVYLRLTGVPVPAIYGASADEEPFDG